MSVVGEKHQTKSISSTFFWAAACLWTTRAAHVAAALLRAALTAAYAEKDDEHESTEDDQQDRQPVWNRQEHVITNSSSRSLFRLSVTFFLPQPQLRKLTVHDEFDFTIRVSRCVTSSIDVAEINAVIPPHHLSDDQVSLC